ncbi:hypothetical protein MMC09_001886 [Bachmanniomyces sp. S44760]|nr:hypothetical protein [Bachmanniomyces sp. S44760]
MASDKWAVGQISRLLPLDDESLQQMLQYTESLSKSAAAEHLKNLLGDSPQALEFIASFNSRREAPGDVAPSSSQSEVPGRGPRKKKPPLNKLPPPRRPDDYGDLSGAYQKKGEEDYIPGGSRHGITKAPLSNISALSDKPDALQLPKPTTSTSNPASRNASPKPPPSAAGSLISDLPNVRSSTTSSRTSSPASAKTKIALSGGTSMHGASATLNDLDSAIRALEIQTNPSLTPQSASENAKRRCTCQATRHPLLAAAPNCLNCGKIICVKEGIGPCTFCSTPLLAPAEIQAMVRALREERGREKMDLNNSSQRKADISKPTKPFQNAHPPAAAGNSTSSTSKDAPGLASAIAHRDKLLTYQSQNARRTHIIDEAADYETPTSGQSKWSSPVERAAQLKRQQKALREQEWNAKPEYEKRRMVVSVDLVGGKVVKRMGKIDYEHEHEQEQEHESQDTEIEDESTSRNNPNTTEMNSTGKGKGTGTFRQNPLLGSLIRPIWKNPNTNNDNDNDKTKEQKSAASPPSSSSSSSSGKVRHRHQQPATGIATATGTATTSWQRRRVQDDNNDDNEALILDGGVYGHAGREDGHAIPGGGAEERAFG